MKKIRRYMGLKSSPQQVQTAINSISQHQCDTAADLSVSNRTTTTRPHGHTHPKRKAAAAGGHSLGGSTGRGWVQVAAAVWGRVHVNVPAPTTMPTARQRPSAPARPHARPPLHVTPSCDRDFPPPCLLGIAALHIHDSLAVFGCDGEKIW